MASTLEQVANDLRKQIEDLEEQLERVDGQGMGTFSLAKRLEEKRKELRTIERIVELPGPCF